MPEIEIDKIIEKNRKRTCNENKVKELAESIKILGLINPITLNKDYVLIAGFHRLQACKQLGWSEIHATILDMDNLAAELIEIDENLIRNPLSALEQAEQMKRRKEIYEILHPESKAKNIKSKNLPKRNDFVLDKPKTFTQDTAEKTGKSQRSIQQDVQIASNISEDTKEKIKGTEIENKKFVLLDIAKQPAEQQQSFIEKLKEETSTPKKEEGTKNELDLAYKVDFVLKKIVVDNVWMELPPDCDMVNRSYGQMHWDANNYNVNKQKELVKTNPNK